MKPKILVLGIGNELCGDDGFGPAVAQEFSRFAAPEVEIKNGAVRGLSLAWLMEDHEIVFVADVVKGIGEPGEVRRLEMNEVACDDIYLSLHELGLSQTVRFMKAAKLHVPKIIVIGVLPERIVFGETHLSDTVAAAVPLAAKMIQEEICSLY